MTPFDPSRYPTAIAELWVVDRLPELGPGVPNQSVRAALQALRPESIAPIVRNREAALGCISGLWLYHDFLDESHTISQDRSGWAGSYWHGIMHRREPDPDNAKYWFRRVKANPVFESLSKDIAGFELELHKDNWDPFAFVDLCERLRGTGSDAEMRCRQLQRHEMQRLFDWCFRQANSVGIQT